MANHFGFAVSYGADNDPKDFARLQAIIKTWVKNKVLAVEERKDGDHKGRKFIVPGPVEAERSANAETDDD